MNEPVSYTCRNCGFKFVADLPFNYYPCLRCGGNAIADDYSKNTDKTAATGETKSCPFCKSEHALPTVAERDGKVFARCERCGTGWILIETWNARPTENALLMRMDDAQKQLSRLAELTEFAQRMSALLADDLVWDGPNQGKLLVQEYREWQGKCIADDAFNDLFRGAK